MLDATLPHQTPSPHSGHIWHDSTPPASAPYPSRLPRSLRGRTMQEMADRLASSPRTSDQLSQHPPSPIFHCCRTMQEMADRLASSPRTSDQLSQRRGNGGSTSSFANLMTTTDARGDSGDDNSGASLPRLRMQSAAPTISPRSTPPPPHPYSQHPHIGHVLLPQGDSLSYDTGDSSLLSSPGGSGEVATTPGGSGGKKKNKGLMHKLKKTWRATVDSIKSKV